MSPGGSGAPTPSPGPLARTLFGKGAVHTHDGEAHRHRKAMFLSLLDPAAAREIAAVADRLWQAAVDRWRDGGRVVVFDEGGAGHRRGHLRLGRPAAHIPQRAPSGLGPGADLGRVARPR